MPLNYQLMLKIVDFFWAYFGIFLLKLLEGFIWVLSIYGGIPSRVGGWPLLIYCWLLRMPAGIGLKVFREILARFWELVTTFPRPGEEVLEPEAGSRFLAMPLVSRASYLDWVFIILAPLRLPMVNAEEVIAGEVRPVVTLSFIGFAMVDSPKPLTPGDILSWSSPLLCGLDMATHFPNEPLLN